MPLFPRILKPVLVSILLMLLGTGFAFSAELDDSTLFVEAFNAYQKKDYLLAIEKIGQLNQVFPDSPLRDVTLLLLARSGYKAGDNELAAKTINQFGNEFPESSLRSGIEDDLAALGSRQKRGEKLLPNKQLKAAARKVRDEVLAVERAAALKAEQERLAAEKAERERLAREKQEAERRERERLAAEKAAKESIKLAIVVPNAIDPVEAGTKGSLPFELVNRGKTTEDFLISAPVAAEYAAVISPADKPGEAISKITLAAGEAYKGTLNFTMPATKVDGFKALLPLKAVSTKFADVTFSKDSPVTTLAPLVRAVVKPHKSKLERGETFKFRLSVLNAGSIAARGLTVRAVLPEQVDFIDAGGSAYRQESAGTIVFRVDQLESGRLSEFNLNVKVRENVAEKQELRCQVEVINSQLQVKESFSSRPAIIAGK